MKKLVLITTFVALALLAGCSKPDSGVSPEPAAPAQPIVPAQTAGFVSATSLAFETIASTGQTITVICNSEWEVADVDGNWFTPNRQTSSVYVTAELNSSGEERTGGFTIRTKDNSWSERITVTQECDNTILLASTAYGRKLVYAAGGYFNTVTKDTCTDLTDGLTSFEMTCTYTDTYAGESSPFQRKLFMFEVDMTKVTLLATLADDNDNSVAKGTRQIIRNQLSALQVSRHYLTVWGGVNADFFNMDTGELRGVMYRGGKCLKDTFQSSVNTVFAVMKDGTACCLTQNEYHAVKANIQEAVGGRQNLIEKGEKVGFTDKALEPRTAAGVSKDGKTVYLLIVDGREEKYKTGSYGASYDALARILKAAGAWEAINLDGGGSSSYIIRNGSSFVLRNQPGNAGKEERAVVNGLAIVSAK